MTRVVFVIFFCATLMSKWSYVVGNSGDNCTRVVPDDKINGICQRKYIRGPSELATLRGCKVIEGSLQMSLLTANTTDVYRDFSFPDLREITGYLLLFSSSKIITLKHFFPNLAVIRGQELIETNSLVIHQMPDLQEVGLPSLTHVLKGTISIVDNANLCYVDTIDWGNIAEEFSGDSGFKIDKNKPQCPNTCNDTCPVSTFDSRRLCWSKDDCQIAPKSCPDKCKKLCTPERECCHAECLGGCNGPKADQCHVCKHVLYENRCTDRCPDNFYEYLNRRCVSAEECLKLTAPPERGKEAAEIQTGKLFTDADGKKQCVLKCPINAELAANRTCVVCRGNCKRNCDGRVVDSIEVARELAGCTTITGALKISIRRGSSTGLKTIVQELKHNLGQIVEIDHYLAITYTYSIHSLEFLENLKIIRGQKLDEEKYGLIVKSNDNLMELWNLTTRSIRFENSKARVQFHYNPKLCPSLIEKFVNQSGININNTNGKAIDIGVTNGDKVPCNTQILPIRITQRSNHSVNIQWMNFRRNLSLTSHLLNYEIHYKELGYPKRTVTKYEDRDPCGDDGWNIIEQAKMPDSNIQPGIHIEKEPEWEDERLVANLKPFTYYALYVKAIVIPDGNSLNNNMGAESELIEFRTWAEKPSKPRNTKLGVGGPEKIKLQWEAPEHPNGIMHEFQIWIKELPETQSVQDQRDFCIQGRSELTSSSAKTFSGIISTSKTSVTESPLTSDPNCCSCSAPTSSSSTTPGKGTVADKKIQDVFDEEALLNAIFKHVFYTDPQGNDNQCNNEIRKQTPFGRRRRSIQDGSRSSSSSEVLDDSEIHLFPNSSGNSESSVHPYFEMYDDDKPPNRTVAYNSTIGVYEVELEGLKHYTVYQVFIRACREPDKEITGNDTRTCSPMQSNRVQTGYLKEADYLDASKIKLNVTDGNRLRITWVEPSSPNGVVMAYTIKVQRISASKDEPPYVACITHKDFLHLGRNYTLPHSFHPGNHSVRIQVHSLARDSEFSAIQYFFVEDLGGHSAGFWVMVTLVPILVMMVLCAGICYYELQKRGIIYKGQNIISVNPEYMRNFDIGDEWEVDRQKIELGEELGQGSFGKVFEGVLYDFIAGNSKMRCAVKTCFEDTSWEDRALFLKEAELMTNLNCNHVVRLLGVVSKTQPVLVIMELMANGDLKAFLRSRRPEADENKNRDPPPTLRQILRISAEIADGMAYIHKEKLVHRDLAARNCMVSENMTVKVGDFGMTKEVVESDYYRKVTKGKLPVRWMAPESLSDGVFTSQSDMWSFGVVVWEMATLAAQPYQGLSNKQVLEYVQAGRTMERPEMCPDILYDLMCQCWQYNPRQRPTFMDVLERLTPDLEPNFAQVSFYHSPDGIAYKEELCLRSAQEELITIRTPLRATFEDDFLDDDCSDDDNPHPTHYLVDDLGDTPSRRLLNQEPPYSSSRSPSVVPLSNYNRHQPSKTLTNGLALTPTTISGNLGSSPSSYSPNRNSLGSSPRFSSPIIPTSSSNGGSLFSLQPPLISSYNNFPLMPNNNYTTAGNYNNKSTSVAATPLIPLPLTNSSNRNGVSNSYNSDTIDGPTNTSSVASVSGPSTSRTGSTPITTAYASIIPNNSQSSGNTQSNTTSAPVNCTTNNLTSGRELGGGDSSSGLESNENSKACSITFSTGEKNRVGNGGTGGGNGYITLRHPSQVNENQKNRTTQF